MTKVNQDLTRRVAELARLKLTDEEVSEFTGQLDKVLGYVEQIAEVNAEGIEPIVHPIELDIPMRSDEVVDFDRGSEGKSKILDAAPDVLYDGFKVPPIL